MEPIRLRRGRLGELLERHRGTGDPGDGVDPGEPPRLVETQPSGNAINATHAGELESHFGDDSNVAVAYVQGPDDVVDAIDTILSTEDDS